eukprot:scaffold710_cov171-Amphora_coffeaeformis.AAC.67
MNSSKSPPCPYGGTTRRAYMGSLSLGLSGDTEHGKEKWKRKRSALRAGNHSFAREQSTLREICIVARGSHVSDFHPLGPSKRIAGRVCARAHPSILVHSFPSINGTRGKLSLATAEVKAPVGHIIMVLIFCRWEESSDDAGLDQQLVMSCVPLSARLVVFAGSQLIPYDPTGLARLVGTFHRVETYI